MKRRINISTRILMVLGAAITLLVGPQAALAAPINNSTNTLKISPVRRDIEVDPGESKKVQATITNLTNTAITVRASSNDFVAGDERGTPALILEEDQFAPSHSLKRHMAPIQNVTIPAKGSKTVDITIKMPKNAKPGGYYGAVRFSPANAEGGGQVNLSTSAATILLVTVPGDVTEKLSLTDFSMQQNGKTGELFGSPNNLQVSARFQNTGDMHEGPFGKVSVMKDSEVVYEADFNNKNPRDMILPDSGRRWEIPLKNIGDFGNYTVTATFTYGKNNQSIEVTKSFWVVPQMLIVAAVIGLIVLIGLIVGIVVFLRRYKRNILRKHGGSGLRV